MARKCFISHKREDAAYKEAIQIMNIDMIDKSLDDAIDSYSEEYIMQTIRRDYLSDSTVTIHLIGLHSAENLGFEEQKYIKRELQGSLFNGQDNPRSGILGVVLPQMYESVYGGSGICTTCRGTIDYVNVSDATVVKEFSANYYIPHGLCHFNEEHRYCVLVKWDNFILSPESYIEQAYAKREHPISSKITVYP